MRKLATLILTIAAFVLPSFVMAAPTPQGVSIYDLNEGGDELTFGAYVCKLDTCDPKVADNWFNYSATGTGIEGDNGQGSTVVVAPGGTVTFLGLTGVITTEIAYNPIYDVVFTGGEYLEDLDFFSGSYDDIDDDGIGYTFNGLSSISFTGPLGADDGLQAGSITAKISEDTPDGTVITGKLSFDDTKQNVQVQNIFANKAYAAEVAQSSVRLLVRNAQAAPVAAQVLPKTGTATSNWQNMIAPAILAISAIFVGFQIARKRTKAKN